MTELKRILLSTDDVDYARLQEHTAKGKCSFLNPKENLFGDRIAMQSFQRSGNTFLRRYIELISGVYTGADMSISFSFHLAMMGLLG